MKPRAVSSSSVLRDCAPAEVAAAGRVCARTGGPLRKPKQWHATGPRWRARPPIESSSRRSTPF